MFVSVFGDERGKEVAIAGLKSKAKYVRTELGKRMKLRLTPEIRFIEDEAMERGSRVLISTYFYFLDPFGRIYNFTLCVSCEDYDSACGLAYPLGISVLVCIILNSIDNDFC